MKWIDIKKEQPTVGSTVVVWLEKRQEPACVQIEKDKYGLIFRELIPVDICCDSAEGIKFWLPLPPSPEEKT